MYLQYKYLLSSQLCITSLVQTIPSRFLLKENCKKYISIFLARIHKHIYIYLNSQSNLPHSNCSLCSICSEFAWNNMEYFVAFLSCKFTTTFPLDFLSKKFLHRCTYILLKGVSYKITRLYIGLTMVSLERSYKMGM